MQEVMKYQVQGENHEVEKHPHVQILWEENYADLLFTNILFSFVGTRYIDKSIQGRQNTTRRQREAYKHKERGNGGKHKNSQLRQKEEYCIK